MGKHKKKLEDEGNISLSEEKSQNDCSKQKTDTKTVRKSKKKKKTNKDKEIDTSADNHEQSVTLENGENNFGNTTDTINGKTNDEENDVRKDTSSVSPEKVEKPKKHKKKKRKNNDNNEKEVTKETNEPSNIDNILGFDKGAKKRKYSDVENEEEDKSTKLQERQSDNIVGDDNVVDNNGIEGPRKKHKKKKRRSKKTVTSDNVITQKGSCSDKDNTSNGKEKHISEERNENSKSVMSSPETNLEAKSKKKEKRKHKDCEPEKEPVEVSASENKTVLHGKKIKLKGEDDNGFDKHADENGNIVTSNENDDDGGVKSQKKKKKKNKVKDTEISDFGDTIPVKTDDGNSTKREDFTSKHDHEKHTLASCTKGQWDTNAFGDEVKQNKFLKLLGGFKKGADTKSIHNKMFNANGNKAQKEIYPKRNSFGGSRSMNKSQQETYKKNMEAEYNSAVTSHLNRGVGLGFQKPEPKKTFAIDTQTSKSMKFDDSD